MSAISAMSLLALVIPMAIAEIILLVVTLIHIFKHDNYKHGNRIMWVIIVIIGMEFVGPILYWVLGREE